jgi:hypothetical protein
MIYLYFYVQFNCGPQAGMTWAFQPLTAFEFIFKPTGSGWPAAAASHNDY